MDKIRHHNHLLGSSINTLLSFPVSHGGRIDDDDVDDPQTHQNRGATTKRKRKGVKRRKKKKRTGIVIAVGRLLRSGFFSPRKRDPDAKKKDFSKDH